MGKRFKLLAAAVVAVAWLPWVARAHPMVTDGLDVVIGRDRVVIDARISMEQVLVAAVNGGGSKPGRERWAELARGHGGYVLKHLHLVVDGVELEGRQTSVGAATAVAPASEMDVVEYRFEYTVARPPEVVRLRQDFLREYEPWTASCVLQMRQEDQAEFESDLLPREKTAEYGCDWGKAAGGGAATTAIAGPVAARVRWWPTFRAYLAHGVMHILTGYDHLLFVCALVLGARSLWDLVKVVTAFTVAHTLTLALSVMNVVTLSERIVEPMIAASIVFVAVQNVLWPRQSRGWTRLAVAFAFGLFHGLGFAGGLKEAMAAMPRVALWTALIGFSAGVELGHQVVVLPLFGGVSVGRRLAAEDRGRRTVETILRAGSVAVAMGGVFFLAWAIK